MALDPRPRFVFATFVPVSRLPHTSAAPWSPPGAALDPRFRPAQRSEGPVVPLLARPREPRQSEPYADANPET
jgi:hypothetical protein